jgi:hypothetical protein
MLTVQCLHHWPRNIRSCMYRHDHGWTLLLKSHDTASTTARSVDEVARIQDTLSRYTPVLIALFVRSEIPVSDGPGLLFRHDRDKPICERNPL